MLKNRSYYLGLNVLSMLYHWERGRATILLKTDREIDLPLGMVTDPFIVDFSFVSGSDLCGGLYYYASEEFLL